MSQLDRLSMAATCVIVLALGLSVVPVTAYAQTPTTIAVVGSGTGTFDYTPFNYSDQFQISGAYAGTSVEAPVGGFTLYVNQGPTLDIAELITGLGIYCSTLPGVVGPGSSLTFSGGGSCGGVGDFTGTVQLVDTTPCPALDNNSIADELDPACFDQSSIDVVAVGNLSLET